MAGVNPSLYHKTLSHATLTNPTCWCVSVAMSEQKQWFSRSISGGDSRVARRAAARLFGVTSTTAPTQPEAWQQQHGSSKPSLPERRSHKIMV